MKEPKLQENMTKTLVTVKWNDPLEQAFRLMEERRIRHLPVKDGNDNLIGIISDRDVNRAMDPQRLGFDKDAVVADFMSWPAVTVDEEMSIHDVAEGMVDEKISAFLVTRNHSEIVGIVTSEDLLRYLANLPREKKKSLKELPYMPVVEEFMKEMRTLGI